MRPLLYTNCTKLYSSLPVCLVFAVCLSLTRLSLSWLQLVTECRNTLGEAIEVRKKYREVMEVVTRSDHSKEQVDKDMEFFESDLNRVLMVSSGERVKIQAS